MPWFNRDLQEKPSFPRLPSVSFQAYQESSSQGGSRAIATDAPVSQQIYPSFPSDPPPEDPKMNQTQSYMDVHTSHFSSPQPYGSHGATAGGMVPYSHYQQPPPLLPPGSTGYPSTQGSYSYPYSNGVASTTQPASNSISSQVPAQILPLPGKIMFFRQIEFIR